ncbi:hypothetical protein MRB53_024330 [Persea americana]|uniref:Uncharacterized protein n=1 Tax=Persea americana TaxID=3435 RepID=A0ACC2LD21_PERAE|nr:hypothetical protein MRB53_024330 [Persea americana]
MAISSPKPHNKMKDPLSPSRSPKSPSIRINGAQINGQTCHQCRQKTMKLVASCKNTARAKGPCPIKFCDKCLLNRYGENAEEMMKLGDWKCPKCRDICNCSICMKKKGQQPTGMLVHAAKATGFSSVMEMLHTKGPDGLGVVEILKDTCTHLNKTIVSSKELSPSKRKHGKENSPVGVSNMQCEALEVGNDAKLETNITARKKLRLDNGNSNSSKLRGKDDGPKRKELQVQVSTKVTVDVTKEEKKMAEVLDGKNIKRPAVKPFRMPKRYKLEENHTMNNEGVKVDVMLPTGDELVNVAGIEFPADDVGPALQFLEFCNAFQQVLNLNKGQGESVLRELIRARVTRRGVYSANIQFHIKLLSLLQKDKGEVSPLSYSANIGSSWLQILGKCISESQFAPKELHLGCLTKGTDAYDKLGSSEKLRILNLLCDEMLGTNCVRTYIEEQHAKYVESKREEKSKIQAAKEKEKLMKQKLKDKVAQIVLSSREGAPLSISEHENLVSKIKADTQKVHAEMVEAKDMVPKKKQRLDAVRTEPLLLDQNGRAYWKLRSHSDGSHILLQDIGNQDLVTPQDKWFIYDDEQEKAVQNYISTTREKRHRKRLIPIAMGSDGTNLKVQLPW